MTDTKQLTDRVRIEWMDTLKFIGIYTIYIAHFLEGAGNIYKFACMYVIQLFFFVSGCFAVSSIQKNTSRKYIIKQIKHLLIPYFLFGIMNMVLIVIQENRTILEILPLCKQLTMGVRNQLFAPALWFLPCLFIVSILYAILYKLLRKNGFTLIACFIIYALTAIFLPFDPTESPRWFFNMDSALCYLFFYALGAFINPYMKNISIENWKKCYQKNKFICTGITVIVLSLVVITTVLTFFGRQDYFVIYPLFIRISLIKWMYPIYIAMCIIIFQIGIAMWLQKIPLINELGRDTLALCGNETMVKTLIPGGLSLMGLGIQIATPLHAYIYAFILLILAHYVMIPIERKLFPKGMI